MIVIIVTLIGVALFAVALWLGARRDAIRDAAALKIREADRAFRTEQIGRIVTAIHGENVLRIAAEEARLYRRNSGG